MGEQAVIAQWTDAKHCSVPNDGSVIGLRVEVRSRLTDKSNRAHERYVFLGDHAPSKTIGMVFLDVVAWFQQPVKLLAELTIPDMDNPALQRWYPVAFVMSMAWLAVFAYLVVGACEGIHEDFGISNSILGFTVAAAGTSFPNVFSGMVVSRQGKTTMALANALGANVQNVFLALALPWMIQSCFITHGPFPMKLAGLTSQVAGIYITLLPLVLVYVCYGSTMPKWSGGLYLVIYVIYVVVSIAQELSE